MRRDQGKGWRLGTRGSEGARRECREVAAAVLCCHVGLVGILEGLLRVLVTQYLDRNEMRAAPEGEKERRKRKGRGRCRGLNSTSVSNCVHGKLTW